jgi:fructose-1-phosphate kinase PfkB-like protein
MKIVISLSLTKVLLSSILVFLSTTTTSTTTAMALSQSIVIVGLNAALQKRFILPPGTNLDVGNVHRAYRLDTGVGGKGQDVGVALSCLISGGYSTPPPTTTNINTDNNQEKVIIAQFLGKGSEGEVVSQILKTKFGLSDQLTIRVAAPLRTCTTIVGANGATELVEMSGIVSNEEMVALHSKIDELVHQQGTGEGKKADCVCIMGSMPPGCNDTTYAELTMRLVGRNSLVLIDSVIGLEPLLGVLKTIFDDSGSSSISSTTSSSSMDKKEQRGGAVLKLNAAELCKLSGVAKSEASQVTLEELSASTMGFVAKYTNVIGSLDYLCITDGKFPGYIIELPKVSTSSTRNNYRTWQLPPVDLSTRGMLYPIGAGDTVAAGTLAAMQYLRRGGGGVITSDIGKHMLDKKTAWCGGKSSGDDDDEGVTMATAFAFGLACGSASCLQEDNSVFDVKDALTFFDDMKLPVVQNIYTMSSIART